MRCISRRSFLEKSGTGMVAVTAIPALKTAAQVIGISSFDADVVFIDGRIITVNGHDEIVEALAIKGNRIIAVGSTPEIKPLIGSQTRIINLKGRTAIPGFIENHIHMTNSPQRTWINIRPEIVSSISDIKDLVSDRIKITPKGEWILAWGYHPERLKEGRHPTRHDLDPVSPNNPVAFKHRE